eukprot:5399216-Amphidinium_carterae.1
MFPKFHYKFVEDPLLRSSGVGFHSGYHPHTESLYFTQARQLSVALPIVHTRSLFASVRKLAVPPLLPPCPAS